MGAMNLFWRGKTSFGNRLKTCKSCPSANYEVECNRTWHHCTKGRYKNITALPIDGECPDFPKPEDNVPGEVIEEAKELKDRIPEKAVALDPESHLRAMNEIPIDAKLEDYV